jgi:acid phosphatase
MRPEIIHLRPSFVRITVLPALLLMSLACQTGLPRPARTSQRSQTNLPKPDHIVIVIEENHGFDEIINSSAAPYINQLVGQGGLLTNFHALYHPSQPNYIDLFSGGNQGVTGDSCPAGPFSVPSLGGSLLKANLTFMGYAEDLPVVGSTACSAPPVNCQLGTPECIYARKHCPWIDFSDVPPTLSVPLTQFPADFSQLPTVSFVIPNLNDDMHNGSIQQADAWLKLSLDAYIQWAKSNNSLFILTWDENQLQGVEPHTTKPPQNQIATLLVGAMVTPGSTSGTPYTHHDLLRTIEDMYGLPLLGGSQNASDITGIWQAGN